MLLITGIITIMLTCDLYGLHNQNVIILSIGFLCEGVTCFTDVNFLLFLSLLIYCKALLINCTEYV